MSMKIAVVGTGGVAEKNYLPYMVERDDIQLSYLNRTRSKAEAVAEHFGGRVAADAADLMADEPDTCLVFTRETDRLDAANALLPFRPKRLFFEKPLAARHGQANVVEEDFFGAREMLQAAHGAGVETAMVFNYRFFDQTRLAREIVEQEAFGQPVHFTGMVHYNCWSHCIDLVLHFMGPAASISAQASSPGMGAEESHNVTVAARLANDATGTLIGTSAIDPKLPLYELTFAYEHGRLSMRDLDGEMEVINYRTGRHERHNLTFDISRWDQYRASFGKAINAYLDSVRDGAPPPIPGVAGLQELQFEAGIKRAIASGATVDLGEAFGLGGLSEL